MSDWRSHFYSADVRASGDALVHPGAPAGGTGPGHARVAPSSWEPSSIPHPLSPAASFFDWTSLPLLDIQGRAEAVLEAVWIARRHAPAAIARETGEELEAILAGVIPGLLMCLAIVGATTALGGAAGAAIGALAGGIGAIPGAVAGASIGLEAGIYLLEVLGVAFLAGAIGLALGEAVQLAIDAAHEAWHAVDDPRSRWYHVDRAGRTLATALGVLMRGVLQGVVAFLLAKGGSAAASRVPELVSRLRSSRFGAAFAAWIEQRWASLLENPRLRPKPETRASGGGSGTGEAASPGGASPPPSKPSAPQQSPARPAPRVQLPKETAPKETAPKVDKAAPQGTSSKAGPLSPAEIKRREALGYDPATQRIRPDEMKTALRVEQETGQPLQRFQPGPGEKGDWIDSNGTVYDGCSPGPGKHLNERGWRNYEQSLSKHLEHPSVNRVVVDVSESGLTPEQSTRLTRLLDSLPPEQQSTLLKLGF